nr:insulin-like peptide 1 [Penaeus japonicus]
MHAHQLLPPLLLLLAMGVECGRRDLVGQQVCGNQLVELLSLICRGRYYSPRERRIQEPATSRVRGPPPASNRFDRFDRSSRSPNRLQLPALIQSVFRDAAKPKGVFAGYSEELEDAFREGSEEGATSRELEGPVGAAWMALLPRSAARDSYNGIPEDTSSSGSRKEERWDPPFLSRRSAFALLKTRERRGFTIVDECCRLKACKLDELLAYCG